VKGLQGGREYGSGVYAKEFDTGAYKQVLAPGITRSLQRKENRKMPHATGTVTKITLCWRSNSLSRVIICQT